MAEGFCFKRRDPVIHPALSTDGDDGAESDVVVLRQVPLAG